ncbi:MAG: NAD(P)H-dependent oxidoreductase subunit E [Betaproteobacteria bacterium]|jgi:(2Fe-2S) ferredoxin
MSHYKYHAFFCLNERSNGASCCEQQGATELFNYAKEQCKILGINGEKQVRVNRAGCLDRCENGPVMVVYPEGVWYTMVDKADVDEIIQSHFLRGTMVDRLLINE